MQVRCPHCRESVDVSENTPFSEMTCAGCGSTFGLLGDATLSQASHTTQTLGHFELIEQVGSGGFGAVWKALDTELQRQVAVKIPLKNRLSPEEADQFFREARAAAQIRHPNIVSVHEVGRENETVYIVSNFVEGVTLADRLTDRHLAPREAAQLCLTIADALHHAHESGVVHRDLKPSNVMMDVHGEPHVMDFGLAKRDLGEVTVTAEGKVMGTPAYMSPEQARGDAHRVDRRTDIYSLGVMLFELVTGERPFRGNARMLIHHVLHDEPPTPRKLNGTVPLDLETICLKCMEKAPERRYGSASEVGEELARFLAGEPLHARPVGRIERLWRRCKRNPLVASLSAVIVLITFTGIVGIGWQLHRTRSALAQTERERDNTRAALNQAEYERNQRQKHFARAVDSVDRMLITVGSIELANTPPEFLPVREAMLEDAAQMYASFLKESSTDPQMQSKAATVYLRLGAIREFQDKREESVNAYDRAWQIASDLHRQHPESNAYTKQLVLAAIGSTQRTKTELPDTRKRLDLARTLLEKTIEEVPTDPEQHYLLCSVYAHLVDVLPTVEEKLALFRRRVSLITTVRRLYSEARKQTWSIDMYLAGLLSSFAKFLATSGRFAESEQILAEVVELRSHHINAKRDYFAYSGLRILPNETLAVGTNSNALADLYANMATAYENAGQSEKANEYRVKAIEWKTASVTTLEKLGPTSWRKSAALVRANLEAGKALLAVDNRNEALVRFESALSEANESLNAYSSQQLFSLLAASAMSSLGDIELQRGNIEKAEAHFRKATDIFRRTPVIASRLFNANPFVAEAWRGRFDTLFQRENPSENPLGLYTEVMRSEPTEADTIPLSSRVKRIVTSSLLRNAANSQNATEIYRTIIDACDTEAHSQDGGLQIELSKAYIRLAGLQVRMGEGESPLELSQRALIVCLRLGEVAPDSWWSQHGLATAHRLHAEALVQAGRTEASLDHFRKSISMFQTPHEETPDSAKPLWQASVTQMKFAWAIAIDSELAKSHTVEAYDNATKAVDHLERAKNPSAAWQFYRTLGAVEYRAGRYEKARDTLTKAVQARQGDVHPEIAVFLAMTCWQLQDEESARMYLSKVSKATTPAMPHQRAFAKLSAEAYELIDGRDSP